MFYNSHVNESHKPIVTILRLPKIFIYDQPYRWNITVWNIYRKACHGQIIGSNMERIWWNCIASFTTVWKVNVAFLTIKPNTRSLLFREVTWVKIICQHSNWNMTKTNYENRSTWLYMNVINFDNRTYIWKYTPQHVWLFPNHLCK